MGRISIIERGRIPIPIVVCTYLPLSLALPREIEWKAASREMKTQEEEEEDDAEFKDAVKVTTTTKKRGQSRGETVLACTVARM